MTPSNSYSNISHNVGRSFRAGHPRVVLTIGGSDPTGGAGIQADLKTFQHFGVHGLSVITAVTVQNTTGVISTNPVSAELVQAQLNALSEDIAIDAIKIGMLTTADVVEVVADFVKEQNAPVVLDPVLASSDGFCFLNEEAIRMLLRRLCPFVSLITPNIPEASLLTGTVIISEAAMQQAALRIIEEGVKAVLLKGGHATGPEARDLFFYGTEIEWLTAPRSAKQVHGTGCVLSSAIASGLAVGMPMRDSIIAAKEFITEMIEAAAPLGRGQEIFQFTSSHFV
jgi:hydroxymethylpyrimidine kinase/phosphomethylpyrimidine kinase